MKGYFATLVVVSLLVLSVSGTVFSMETGKVEAMVNKTPILSVEVEQEVLSILPMSAGLHGKMSAEKMSALRKEALQRLVDSELKYQDAQVKGVQLNSEERAAAIKQSADRFKNKAELESAIKEAGFTKDQFEHFIIRPLLAARITKIEVDDKVTTTDAMVKEFYEKNAVRYSKPKEFRASHILFKVDPSFNVEEKGKIRKRAEDVMKRLKEGADFGTVASKESDDMTFIKGGDMGYFHAGQILPEMENVLNGLKVGEMSSIIETIYGFHIVKLTELRDPRQIPFNEIKDKIKKDMIDSEKKRLKEQWVTDITKKAVITYPLAK